MFLSGCTIGELLHDSPGNPVHTGLLNFYYRRASVKYNTHRHVDAIADLNRAITLYHALVANPGFLASLPPGFEQKNFHEYCIKYLNLRAMCHSAQRNPAKDCAAAVADYEKAFELAMKYKIPCESTRESPTALPTSATVLHALGGFKVGQARPHFTPQERKKWQKKLRLGPYKSCFNCLRLPPGDEPLASCGKCRKAKCTTLSFFGLVWSLSCMFSFYFLF